MINSHQHIENDTRIFICERLFTNADDYMANFEFLNILNWNYSMVGRIMEVCQLQYSHLSYNADLGEHKCDFKRIKNNKQCRYIISPHRSSFYLCPLHSLSSYIILSDTPLDNRLFPSAPTKKPAKHVNTLLQNVYAKWLQEEGQDVDESKGQKIRSATSHGFRVSGIDALSENPNIPFSGATDRAGLANEHFSNWFRYLTGGGKNDRITAATLADWPPETTSVKVLGTKI
jgi:hypothetical protein